MTSTWNTGTIKEEEDYYKYLYQYRSKYHSTSPNGNKVYARESVALLLRNLRDFVKDNKTYLFFPNYHRDFYPLSMEKGNKLLSDKVRGMLEAYVIFGKNRGIEINITEEHTSKGVGICIEARKNKNVKTKGSTHWKINE